MVEKREGEATSGGGAESLTWTGGAGSGGGRPLRKAPARPRVLVPFLLTQSDALMSR